MLCGIPHTQFNKRSFIMQIDTQKTAQNNLISIVNATNATALTAAEIQFGLPEVFNDPEGINTRNTQVLVSAVDGSPYTGAVTVRYNRLDLEGLQQARNVTELSYTLGAESSLQTILDAVVTQLDVVASDVELSISEMPVIAELEDFTVIQLVAKSDSLLYLGQVNVLVFKAPEVLDPLDGTITNPELDGFDQPV